MTYINIEIKNLSRHPNNVRKTEPKAALEELKASILAQGLINPPTVIPAKKGKYQVIAGGRRLAALQELQAEGKLPDDYAVPCLVKDGNAEEISLAENVVRVAMHPADEFEAFAALAEKGLTAAEIGVRFGKSERYVLQRMKLGRLAPKLLDAMRKGELSVDAATAFTVTDDHKKQLAVWKSLPEYARDNPHQIRRLLTEGAVKAGDKLAQFVTLEAYKAAGGTVREDLFQDTVYLDNPEILEKLAAERLEAERGKLLAEGWGWVEIESDNSGFQPWQCGRIQAKPVDVPAELTAEIEKIEKEAAEIEELYEEAENQEELAERHEALQERHVELSARIKQYRRFDPEEMRQAGCYLRVNREGVLDVDKGLVRPEDRKPMQAERDAVESEAALPAKKKEKPLFGKSLVADLETYRLQAAQVEIAKHPEIAFDLLVFTVAKKGLRGCADTGLNVSFPTNFGSAAVNRQPSTARKVMEEMKESLPLAWLEAETESEQFAAFRKLEQADKLAILAYYTARALRPRLAGTGAYEDALTLTGGKAAAYWRPTREAFLDRVSKAYLLGIGKSIFGEQWANRRKDSKKATLAAELEAAFAEPGKHKEADRLRAWMPEGMEFREPVAEPVEKPKKKGKAA